VLVTTDTVTSADGLRVVLAELHAACRARGALLLADEAHALGLAGPGGRGLCAECGLAGDPDVVRTVTLSKSLGSQGGAVLGTASAIDHLVSTARTFRHKATMTSTSALYSSRRAGPAYRGSGDLRLQPILGPLRQDEQLPSKAPGGRWHNSGARRLRQTRPPRVGDLGGRVCAVRSAWRKKNGPRINCHCKGDRLDHR
jgi:Aminotransferase class I and II